jgi:saccharopine dehydrogenase (NAD+, L-lysine-forming)
MKIGIIKEGKVPHDKRVALTPKQCRNILDTYKDIDIYVESSDIRCINDSEYIEEGIKVSDDVSNCDLLIGIKEVPIEKLISNKTYMFFSHTIKLQEHNKKLLKALINKNIKLIDYEVITDYKSKRLIGFGKYAGIVGAYNGFILVGKKFNLYDIQPAYIVDSRLGIEEEMKKIKLPNNFKIVMTGDGRVANGTLEVLKSINIREVNSEDFLNKTFDEPVYTRLKSQDLYHAKEGEWDTQDFYNNPHKYSSSFVQYTKVADMYLACHYWNPKADIMFTKEDMRASDFKIKVIADISCDIDGPIPSTIRASSIPEPFYGYDPILEKETDFNDEKAIAVMAVDNLPCELPKDASEDFGNEFISYVLPNIVLEDKDKIIERATITENGKLNEKYNYMNSMLI